MTKRRLSSLSVILSVLVVMSLALASCAPAATQPPPAQPTTGAAEPVEPTEAVEPAEPAEPTSASEATAEEPAEGEQTPEEPAAELPEDFVPVTEDLSPDVSQPAEPVTVSFASWVGSGFAYQALAEQFHELYPNITIEFQDIPFEEIRTKLLTQVAANNPPDVAYLSSGDVGAFATRNALVSLDNYLLLSQAVTKEDYVKPFLDATIVEGSVYGLPLTAETTGIFYRTDLFEAAGLDPNNPPKTWAEFQDAAQKLTDPAKKQYGFILFAPEMYYYWYPWLWQAGGQLLSDDEQTVMWNSDAAKKAAEFYVGLKEYSPPDFYNSNSWDGRVAFANGTVAMYEAGAWFAGTLQSEFPDIEGKWAAAPMPADEQCATTIAGDAVVIFKGSKNPDAAWKWIEFLSAAQNMTLINLGTPDAPTTLLPPRTSLLEDPATYAANPILEGFKDNMDCAVVYNYQTEAWPEMETILNEYLGSALYGEISASDALDQSAAEAQALAQ